MTRDQARAAGCKRYTGVKCKRGHFERFTSTGACCECARIYYSWEHNPERAKKKNTKDKETLRNRKGTLKTNTFLKDQSESKKKASKAWVKWGYDDTKKLTDLLDQGVSRFEIALQLGRSRNAINRRVENIKKKAANDEGK